MFFQVWFWLLSVLSVLGGDQEPVAKAYQVPEAGSWMMQGSGKLYGRRGVLVVAETWPVVVGGGRVKVSARWR
jgi:hypothetical protein